MKSLRSADRTGGEEKTRPTRGKRLGNVTVRRLSGRLGSSAFDSGTKTPRITNADFIKGPAEEEKLISLERVSRSSGLGLSFRSRCRRPSRAFQSECQRRTGLCLGATFRTQVPADRRSRRERERPTFRETPRKMTRFSETRFDSSTRNEAAPGTVGLRGPGSGGRHRFKYFLSSRVREISEDLNNSKLEENESKLNFYGG